VAGARQAMRHAGYKTTVQGIRVQREHTTRGKKADDFVAEPRFSKHGLWHVSVEGTDAISAPVVILGVMIPIRYADNPRWHFSFKRNSFCSPSNPVYYRIPIRFTSHAQLQRKGHTNRWPLSHLTTGATQSCRPEH